MSPRVLVLFEYPSVNGGENSFLTIVDSLRADGFELFAAAPAHGGLAAALRAVDLPVEPFDLTARIPQSARRAILARVLKHVDPQLLHANSLAMSRLAGPTAAEAGVPSLGHLRDIVRLSPAAVSDLNRHTRLLAVSQATRHWHMQQGLAARKIVVVPNGVNLGRFRPTEPTGWLHRELGIAAGVQLIGAIGQIGRRKGVDVLIRGFKMLARVRPDAHLVIVGERYSQKAESIIFEQEVRRSARDPAVDGRIHFLGRRSDVPAILPELVMLAHAARQEPLGRVLLEAAACGLPVVATRVGGTAEIFPDHPPCGALLIPAGDHQALARQMRRLLERPAEAHWLGRQARGRVEAAFGQQRAGRQLAGQYRAILGGEA